MAAIFESEFPGREGSNYGWSAVSIFEANGTEDGKPIGIVVDTFGDEVISDQDIPRLISALLDYVTSRDVASRDRRGE